MPTRPMQPRAAAISAAVPAGHAPDAARPAAAEIDVDALMQAHLQRVFGEPDAERRSCALRQLYAEDATLFEPHATATGHAAISRAVDALQASLPRGFSFRAVGPAIGHHGVARLHWSAGPPDGRAAATGTDVAHVQDGRIRSLHVFLDPAPRG